MIGKGKVSQRAAGLLIVGFLFFFFTVNQLFGGSSETVRERCFDAVPLTDPDSRGVKPAPETWTNAEWREFLTLDAETDLSAVNDYDQHPALRQLNKRRRKCRVQGLPTSEWPIPEPIYAPGASWPYDRVKCCSDPSTTPLSLLHVEGLSLHHHHGAQDGSCFFEFSKYVPSEFEEMWIQKLPSLHPDRLCLEVLTNTTFRKFFDKYMEALPQCAPHLPVDKRTITCEDKTGKPVEASAPQHFDPAVFSRMEYHPVHHGGESHRCQSNGTQTMFIEPLVGLLRHPGYCFNVVHEANAKKFDLVDKGYMVVDPWHPTRNFPAGLSGSVLPPRSFFFDIGASTWRSGFGGVSQPWFHSIYANQCVRFDRYFLWEVSASIQDVLDEVPGYIKSRYQYYREPANPDRASWNNPLNTLLMETTPEDFVVLKLDIDFQSVEEGLIRIILEEPEVSKRIDQLFFEHHVRGLDVLSRGPWAASVAKGEGLFANDSIAIFTALRRRGIVAHSWV